jgi:ribosome-associated protein
LKTTTKPSKAAATSIAKVTRSSKLFKSIIKAIADKKGEAIVSLDLRKIDEAVADFFIVCQAGNTTLLGAIVDNIEKEVQEATGEKCYKREGKKGNTWILIDYVNIVIHCFMPETRAFYKIEEMWSDADFKEHNDI